MVRGASSIVILLFFIVETMSVDTSYWAKHSQLAENGDIIDCTHIYAQPSFLHLLRKNQTDQIAKEIQGPFSSSKVQSMSGSCPEGTIPIMRMIGNITTNTPFYPREALVNRGSLDPQGNLGTVFEMVLAYAYNGPYKGGRGTFEIWNPHVEPSENSATHLSLLGAGVAQYNPGDPLPIVMNMVSVGWMVCPELFKDSKTRFFVYWSNDADKSKDQGCYNLDCPGYRHLSTRIAVGAAFDGIAPPGRQSTTHVFTIVQDELLQRWYVWLDDERVGYWPNSIFTGFYNCHAVTWGGTVLNRQPNGLPTNTQMGNGIRPSANRSAVLFQNVAEKLEGDFAHPFIPSKYISDRKSCYNYREIMQPLRAPGFAFTYGGPGASDASVVCDVSASDAPVACDASVYLFVCLVIFVCL